MLQPPEEEKPKKRRGNPNPTKGKKTRKARLTIPKPAAPQPGSDDPAPSVALSPLEARFVDAYCGKANCNATEAAEAAGYNCTSRGSFSALGSTVLARPHVRAAVQERFAREAASAEEVVKRMTADARISAAAFIKFDTDGKPQLNLTQESLEMYGTLIKEIDVDPETGRIFKVRLNDSQAARRDLAKILRLFSDGPVINLMDLQNMTDDDLVKQLDAARTRMRGPTLERHIPQADAETSKPPISG